jgi:uncharacterized repeat protein (TIGR01451 family)
VPGPEVIKGGVTLNQLVNIGVAVGQNLPYNHVVQAWSAQSGASLPSFPQAVDDFQLLSSPAVADVSAASGKEIVVGTGLYYLRSMNVTGVEAGGWPKFTGGWIFSVPAIGDVDRDGLLEIAALTREGYAFLWNTNRPACGTNDEWWTSRHDEWSTGAYGTDSRPPGTPRKLQVRHEGNTAGLRWIAPGDDWLCGRASRYRIIKSSSPIVHPTDGTVVGEFTANASAGQPEHFTLSESDLAGSNYFAVLYEDNAGNWGHLKSVRFAADLTIAKDDAPDPVAVGQNLTYTVRVRNNGPNAAKRVVMVDTLPIRARFVSANPSQGECGRRQREVICELGLIHTGATATVDIVVQPTQAGTITNRATVRLSRPADLNQANNSTAENTTVTGTGG